MTRTVRVHRGVEADLLEAFSYFENNAPEHVDRLYRLFIEATTNTIPRLPHAYAPLFGQYRHFYLRPFAYYVAYHVTDATIDILAVRHGAQRPEAVEADLGGRTFD